MVRSGFELGKRILLHALVFALGLLIIGLGDLPLRADRVGWGEIPDFEEKLTELKTEGARYDTLFLGTSRVFRHINPAVFDGRMAELGTESSSYNAGMFGLTMVEFSYLIHAVREMPDLAPKRIFVEPLYSNAMKFKNIATQRVIKTHTLDGTVREIAHQMALGKSIGKGHYKVAAMHGLAFCYNRLGYGFWTRYVFGDGVIRVERTEAPTRAGYVPLEEETATTYLERSALFRDEMEKANEQFFSPPGEAIRPLDVDEAYVNRLAELLVPLEESGAEIVFFFSPQAVGRDISESFARSIQRTGRDWKVLSEPSDGKYSALYDAAYWFDIGHLRQEGAAIYSRGLAEDYCATLGKG